MSGCFMVRAGAQQQVLSVRRSAALGDALCATVICDRLAELGVTSVFQSHTSVHCILRRVPSVSEVQAPNGFAHVNLDGAYEKHPLRRQRHFHEMFYDAANTQLRHFGIDLGKPYNCRPKMRLRPNEVSAIRSRLNHYPHPWVFVCPRSDSYTTRQVPDGIWHEAALKIQGTKFWIGRHPGPAALVDLQCRYFDSVIEFLSVADILLTVDTGPMHVAAALGVPIIAIDQSSHPELHLNDQNDFVTIKPPLPCLGCMENICPKNQWVPPCQNVSHEVIAMTANERLSGAGLISAVVCIYQPRAEVLNQCLNALVNQVDEIVVSGEARSVVPPGAMHHPKIRYVKTTRAGIGFSGNCNFGVRHSRGSLLLIINDDCFLKPDAVARMRECLKPGIGIVSNLLRYPDGSIYHAGKVRHNGSRGWGHIDYKQQHPTFSTVAEIENCCGCCILVPRKVYYQAGCFDEELPLFAQDDAFALCVRRLGYKILFTPHSEGTHLEHASVNKIGNVMDLVNAANAVFHRKWHAYLDHNLNRTPFGDFEY